jgi:hypothetical protein
VFRNGKGGQTSLKTLKSAKISLPKATMKLTLLLIFIFYFSASVQDADYGENFKFNH